MKSKSTRIKFPVFSNYTVHVEITSDLKKSLAKYSQTKHVDATAVDALAVHITDESYSFIFLGYNTSVGNIAHESWHVVRRMMNYLNVELDSETVAYHLGYLTDKIYAFIRNR